MLLFPLLLLLCRTAVFSANGLTITTPQELIDFSSGVNSGNTYSGETVYLSSDLDFTPDLSSRFVPIGNESNHFSGTFDGQGHVIRNLVVNVSLKHAGLFGYSYEDSKTIRSVVMDESCSIVNSYNDYSDIGSIIGYCGRCLIENIVNMASVSFTGKSSNHNFCVSGIVGRLLYSTTIRNCVNYGSVTYSGVSVNSDAYIGGIVGLCGSSGKKSIENCANYGTLVHNGTSSELYMGGIAGYNFYGTVNIENCVSAGKILNITSGSGNTYIGSVVGHISSKSPTTITHCFWISNVGCDTVYGYKESSASVTFVNSSLTELNTTTMSELNTYTERNSTWSKWFMLHLNGGNISDTNQGILVVTQKHFPDPVKNGRIFLFWCTDTECAEKYYPNTTDITEITDLYVVWDVNIKIFDFGNGTKTEKDVAYGEKYGDLPDAEREGYTFNGWYIEENGNGEKITSETAVRSAYNTFYAYWTINNYTLTFIFDNGESEKVRTLNYNDVIVYPSDPVREGYSFNGWDTDVTTMPSHNITIKALWTKNAISNLTPGFVEIVFGDKDLSKEEIKTIINEYTDEDFIIEKIEIDEKTGETKVIVKFNDKKIAEKFVEEIKASSEVDIKNIVKSVDFTVDSIRSFSFSLYPSNLNFICL